MDAVQTPGVERPAFAGRHVHLLGAALEPHRGLGDDRHVNAHVVAPIVVRIDVRRDLGVSGQAHQARTAPGGAEDVENLHEIRAGQQVWGGPHGASARIVRRVPAGGDQRQGVVARELHGMRSPGALRDRGHFIGEADGVEQDRQLEKADTELHCRSTSPREPGLSIAVGSHAWEPSDPDGFFPLAHC